MGYANEDRPSWDGGEYASQFGKAGSFMPPKVEDIERNPDKLRSASVIPLKDDGTHMLWPMRVRGVGAMTIRTVGEPVTGRTIPLGMSCFSDDMLSFGLEAEDGHPDRC